MIMNISHRHGHLVAVSAVCACAACLAIRGYGASPSPSPVSQTGKRVPSSAPRSERKERRPRSAAHPRITGDTIVCLTYFGAAPGTHIFDLLHRHNIYIHRVDGSHGMIEIWGREADRVRVRNLLRQDGAKYGYEAFFTKKPFVMGGQIR